MSRPMFEERIIMPRFDWLCPDLERPYTFNIFTSSACTDEFTGCVNMPTFEYKLKPVQEEGKPPYIIVSYRIPPAWPKSVEGAPYEEKIFDCTPEQMLPIRDWLYGKMRYHLYRM